MSSPPASPGRKRSSATAAGGAQALDPKSAAAAAANSNGKTSARKNDTKSVPAKDAKPKTKKELEADRLAAEEAERNKPAPTGSGQFEFSNGAIYDGEWQLFEDGGKKRHGFGRFTNGGEVYEGQWKEGNICGKGKYTFASNATSVGRSLGGDTTRGVTKTDVCVLFDSVVLNCPSFLSSLCLCVCFSYSGEWLNNKFHGRGSYEWPNGATYIGDWYENKMHGNGAFLATSGDRYQGLFQNDRFQNEQGHWIAPMQGTQTIAK